MLNPEFPFKRYSTAIYDYESEVDKGLQVKRGKTKICILCAGTARINITAKC